MKNALLLLVVLVVSCTNVSHAFHERVGRGNSIVQRKQSKEPQVRHLFSMTLARRRGEDTTSALSASRQFRNVEEMIDSFREELVLINFMAINCGPCRLQKKELAAVSRVVGEDLHMLAIDTNRWPSVSSRFDVGKLPCLVALKNGQVLFRLEGYTKAEDVVAQVRSVQQQQHQYHL